MNTQISFGEFAAAQAEAAAPKKNADEREKYLAFFEDREQMQKHENSLDLPGQLFLMLHVHHSTSRDNEPWKVARRLSSRIIEKGCEPKIKPYAPLELGTA